jgi:hypothetical protein
MCIGLGSTDRRRALCNREFSIASEGAASGGQRTEMASKDQGVVLAHDVENPMNDPATVVAAFLPEGGVMVPGSYYWLLAGPAVFAASAVAFRQREHRAGVGSPSSAYRRTAIILLVAFLLLFPVLALSGAAMAAVALGLLALAVWQRNAAVAAAALVFGTVGVLESLFIISNAVGRLTGVSVAEGAVIGALGASLLIAGALARLRERASA